MATSRKRGWSWAAGEKGKNRVRVYDRGCRGIFLDVYVRDPLLGTTTRKRISLGRVDRETAKRKAEELAAALRGNGQLEPTLTIGLLFDSYETHVTPTKGVGARKHDHRTLEMLRRYFGAQRPVDSLDRRLGWVHPRPTRRNRSAGGRGRSADGEEPDGSEGPEASPLGLQLGDRRSEGGREAAPRREPVRRVRGAA